MRTLVTSAHSDGLSCHLVTIECGFLKGFTGVQMLGCASDICRDGKERARAALERLGMELPQKRLMINMAPADLPKNGNQFDLPLAVSLALLMTEKPLLQDPHRWLFAAELSLDGQLRPVKNVVSFAIAAVRAGLAGIIVARENAAALNTLAALPVENFSSFKRLGFNHLEEVLEWLLIQGQEPQRLEMSIDAEEAQSGNRAKSSSGNEEGRPDFSDMLLTPELERLAICVAAGHHSLLLQGSPGTGKSMFASRLPSILPPMRPQDHLEALQIHSILSEWIPQPLLQGSPPYRAPHHGASANAILGNHEHPGELSLAHGGVLFLDELTEFRRDLLESLREPLESGVVRLARTQHRVNWDCRVILLAACNPCPCGFSGSSRRQCLCSQKKIQQYRLRLSGPILERIDLHMWMPESERAWHTLLPRPQDQRSRLHAMRAQVAQARAFARNRHEEQNIYANRDISGQNIVVSCGYAEGEITPLLDLTLPKSISNRVMLKVLRVARTLADIDECTQVGKRHIEEAMSWQHDAVAKRLGWHLPDKEKLQHLLKEAQMSSQMHYKAKDRLDPQRHHWSYQ